MAQVVEHPPSSTRSWVQFWHYQKKKVERNFKINSERKPSYSWAQWNDSSPQHGSHQQTPHHISSQKPWLSISTSLQYNEECITFMRWGLLPLHSLWRHQLFVPLWLHQCLEGCSCFEWICLFFWDRISLCSLGLLSARIIAVCHHTGLQLTGFGI
jgi:hypothetical protein